LIHPPKPRFGQEVTVSGTLTDPSGKPIRNAPIQILVNGSPIATVKTNDRGFYSYKFRLNTVGTATISARFAGGFYE